MQSRRAFIMGGLGAAAIGAVTLVTTLLVRKKDTPRTVFPTVAPPKAQALAPTGVPTTLSAPQVIVMTPRRDWGAREPAVTPDGRGENGPYDPLSNPSGWLIYDQPLTEVLDTIIIHHSALPLTDGPLAIQKLHMEEKGFADIGYHYLIDNNGKLFEGRSMTVRGAHTYAFNYGSVGICLIGNFEEIEPTEVQFAVLRALLGSLAAQYPRIQRLAGHKDFNPNVTLCPGKNLYPRLPALAKDFGFRYGL